MKSIYNECVNDDQSIISRQLELTVCATMGPAKIFVDVECLLGIFGELVVKELGVTTLAGVLQSWIFEPPCHARDLPRRIRKQNRWISAHIHRINWNQGDVSYDKLTKILSSAIPRNATVYVKGLEKKELLQDILYAHWRTDIRIIDLADLGCPRASTIKHGDKVVWKCAHKHKER